MNKWSNYGKWRHPEKRKELMKDREEKITSDTHSNRLKDDIRTEFDKIKWMIDEYIQVLKVVAQTNAIGKLFTVDFADISSQERMYILVSAIFYIFSI